MKLKQVKFASQIKEYLNDFVGILYPPLCAACGEVLMKQERVLCLSCLAELPRTNFHQHAANEVAQMFWGRLPVEHATAFIYFYQDSRYRQILHAMKYRGQYQTGIEMGRLFGTELLSTPFAEVDVIHPVPLHPKKKRQRGYNQSAMIARGMAKVLQITVAEDLIRRMVNAGSQTNRSKDERWENVEGIFEVSAPERFRNKHILLVDDVVTTGSTLEACAGALKHIENVRVSMAALAYVKLD